MTCVLNMKVQDPILNFEDNIVTEVNTEFEYLTNYTKNEVLGKSVEEICGVLKMHSPIQLEEVENKQECYIFTKENNPREVNINCKVDKDTNKSSMILMEKKHSRIEERLSYAVSVMNDNEKGIAIYSFPDLYILKANQKFSDNVGATNKKIENYLGKSIKGLFPNFNGSQFERIILNTVKTGENYYEREFKYHYPVKGNVYLDSSLVPVYINGEIKYLVHATSDVTENVVMKKIIKEQKQELEAIIENMTDEMIIFNKYGKYTKVNKAARANPICYNNFYYSTGLHRKTEFLDKDGKLIHPDEMPLRKIIKGEKVKNLKVTERNNEFTQYKELSGTPIYDSEGNFIAGVLVSHDISERLKYEENLYAKAQYDSLSRIIENMDLGFSRVTYPEMEIIDMNNKAYKRLKKVIPYVSSQSCIKGQNLYDIFKLEADIIKLIDRVRNSMDDKSHVELYKQTAAGEELYYRLIFQPLCDINNHIFEMLIIEVDITEEVKAKNIIENALKIQDDVYANVSHELKTPLNVIYSANQVMEMYLSNNCFEDKKEKFYSYNLSIKQNCFRLIKLINNILDLSKIKSGFAKLSPGNENIVEIVEDIVESVSDYVTYKELNIIFDTDTEEKIIACDYEKIERIMLNIISNAIKFSNPGGEIHVNVSDKGELVEISVKDNGIGIDKMHLDSIFKRFYQEDKSLSRNAEGSGIGLSLVKSFVEMHDGKISVESEINKGSTFTIKLPSRAIEQDDDIKSSMNMKNKADLLNIEFSDIYY